MDRNGLLDFNYPLLSKGEISHGLKIKQALRDLSYNELEEREIGRYSDKYISAVSHEDIRRSINIELMSPELIKMYGADFAKDVDVVHADAQEHSSDRNEEEAGNESLGGGDDYSGYFNDEDELVDNNDAADGDNAAVY